MSDTVRVRIAVAVDEKGRYGAVGQSEAGDIVMRRDALAYLGGRQGPTGPIEVVYVEADVPLPASRTIPGEVRL